MQVKPSRTEELILSELQKLSARMSNMEQELEADTVTSTPRKRKKSKGRSRKGEDSVIRSNINLTDTQTTFDDSMAHTGGLPSLRGLSHGQEQIQQQQWGITGGLPTSQQAQEHSIIPSLQALRSTAVNQEMVQRRLEELQQQAIPQDTGKIINFSSSRELGSVTNNTKKGKKEKVEVVWPQDCAFVGHLRAQVTYEQLTQSQFVLGFLCSVQEEVNPYIRSNMVDYLTELFQNVCDFGWQAAKGTHLVVMTKMEDGLVT